MPRGGFRVGAGRKPKSAAKEVVSGRKSEAAVANYAQPAVNPPQVDEADAPNELTTEERHVWLRLAPGALAAKTLTKATEYAFILLCRNVVLEHRLRADVEKCGGADHRGVMNRIDSAMTAFLLRPLGKAMEVGTPEAKPVSALERLQAQGAGLRAVK